MDSTERVDDFVWLMDKPNFPEKQTPWGTWEELLLACAVHRFGTQSWDAVAAELRKRSSALHVLTPHACNRKFHDLRRRFTQNDAAADDKSTIPWLDQLRERRLDELRRELQRYDHSIVSLQSKVERLREQREQSLQAAEKSEEKSDLEKTGEAEINKQEASAEPENGAPAKKDLSGEASARDDRSVNESNSMNPKPEVPETGVADVDKTMEPAEPAGEEVEPVEKSINPAAVEDSCNGSSDSVAKEAAVAESEKGNSGGLRESVAESKGGREEAAAAKESPSNSEVQSSASLSRKAGGEPEPVGPKGRDEPDQEDQSPAFKRVPLESQPLVDFLEILRANEIASFFERRLHSQESPVYSNMIRKHVDFEMVQARLEGGWYSRCSRSLFFRDLLLICNNAVVFFEKRTPEYKAARELQLLVSKEMSLQAPKQDPPPKEETPAQPLLPSKPESETSDSLLAKSKLSLPMNACRKRSSIAARASTSSSGPDRKNEQTTASFCDAKPALSWKQKEESSDEGEKLPVTKKSRKERSKSSTRNNENKNGSSRSNTNNEGKSDANANAGSSSRAVTRSENAESKAEAEKKNGNNASGKKRSAANFLSRMKKTSSNKESLPDASKTPENNSKGGRPEQKRNRNGRGNAQKEQPSSRRGSGGRQAEKEQESPTKKNVRRPTKRATPPATTATPAKRARQRR